MSYSEINNPPTVSCMAVNLLAMKYTYVRAHSFLSLADTHDFQNLMVQFFKRANESRNLALASCFVSLSCLCKENGFSSFFFFSQFICIIFVWKFRSFIEIFENWREFNLIVTDNFIDTRMNILRIEFERWCNETD